MNEGRFETSFRDVEGRVEDQLRDVSGKLRSFRDRMADLVREHPAASLAGAFTLGYILARLARRS